MNFLSPELTAYVDAHTAPESPLLAKINRETHLHVLRPRMLSGHLQGRVLAMISWMVRPHRVLEVGTYTGYSALCLAEGLAEGGKVITLDINEELEERVRGYIEEGGLSEQIDYRIGNALEVIPELDEQFDLIFIDADKANYARYYDLVFDKVRPGGFIMADNVLWSGKVAPASDSKIDADTRGMLEFNRRLHEDERVENVLLPIRDGVMIVRKK